MSSTRTLDGELGDAGPIDATPAQTAEYVRDMALSLSALLQDDDLATLRLSLATVASEADAILRRFD